MTGDKLSDLTRANPAKPSAKTSANSLPALMPYPAFVYDQPLYSIVGRKSDPRCRRATKLDPEWLKKPKQLAKIAIQAL
jgi:hypothetical protein